MHIFSFYVQSTFAPKCPLSTLNCTDLILFSLQPLKVDNAFIIVTGYLILLEKYIMVLRLSLNVHMDRITSFYLSAINCNPGFSQKHY